MDRRASFGTAAAIAAAGFVAWEAGCMAPAPAEPGPGPGPLHQGPPEGRWTTEDVSGTIEVIHAWGRTAPVRPLLAMVSVRAGHIQLDVKPEQPTLDGARREGYFFPPLRGPLADAFPYNFQTITKREVHGVAEPDGANIYVTRATTIVFEGGMPIFAVFAAGECANFDVAAMRARLAAAGGLAAREAEHLEGFDERNCRTRGFFAAGFRQAEE